jgi:hypothetical protein
MWNAHTHEAIVFSIRRHSYFLYCYLSWALHYSNCVVRDRQLVFRKYVLQRETLFSIIIYKYNLSKLSKLTLTVFKTDSYREIRTTSIGFSAHIYIVIFQYTFLIFYLLSSPPHSHVIHGQLHLMAGNHGPHKPLLTQGTIQPCYTSKYIVMCCSW